jgi:hypothetical protein
MMLREMQRTQTVHEEVLERHGRVLEAMLRRLEVTGSGLVSRWSVK